MNIGLGFGTWRLFLALLVGLSHLWAGMLHGPAAYAVWGFFVLSGYLMNYVLQTKYGFTAEGIRRYGLNRFLRIYPGFWVACVLGALSLIWLDGMGIDARRLNPAFALPRDAGEWGFIATLLPLFPRWNGPVPVASALSVEVGYYLFAILLAQHRTTAWLALVFGCIVAANFGISTATFNDRYALFLPAAPAFAVGSLLCHYRKELTRFRHPVLSVACWLLHCGAILIDNAWPWTWGLYVSVLLSGWVVISLAELKTSKADEVMGELSYPFYLLHCTAGAVLLAGYGYDRSLAYALAAVALTFAASWAMVRGLDRRLARRKSPAMPAGLLRTDAA
jgi:peptidoglycan/LPS O-acetylase OafA/YrhL